MFVLHACIFALNCRCSSRHVLFLLYTYTYNFCIHSCPSLIFFCILTFAPSLPIYVGFFVNYFPSPCSRCWILLNICVVYVCNYWVCSFRVGEEGQQVPLTVCAGDPSALLSLGSPKWTDVFYFAASRTMGSLCSCHRHTHTRLLLKKNTQFGGKHATFNRILYHDIEVLPSSPSSWICWSK